MDITELKAIIDANIFENTSQAITGDALNDVLNLIADSLGEYVPATDIFDEAGTIRSALLPSYVDDVLEFSSRDAFPTVGEGGKIYLAADTNLSYRWGGSEYVIIAQSLALGETSSTAYRGDRGKIAYDHSQTSHRLSIAGLEVSALGGSIATEALASALSIPELRNAVTAHIGNGIIHITADERTAWNKFASYFYIDEQTGNLVTDRNVIIRKNLTVGGDTSTGGKGEDTGVSGTVTGIRVDATTILEPTNGIVDMSDVLANIDVDLSNYYTKQETISEIAKVVDGLNLGQYAKASELATLQTEVDNIEAVLGMDEEAAGIINTWEEVKAFLDGYSSSDDLAAILSAMNADIAKRALASDLDALALTVGDNATNIRNLKASVYTKDDLAAYKSWWDDLMSLIVKEGNDIKIKTNLIVTGDTTTGGTGSDAGTSGTVIGVVVNGKSYEDETNGMLDLSMLMNQYALTSAIPSLEGYAKIADVSAALTGYQPLITASNKLDYSLIANTPGLKSLAFKDSLAISEIVGLQSALSNKQDAATAITTSNIGSQSVNYATNANLLDGYNASSFAKVASPNDLIHAGNEFTFASSAHSGNIWFNFRTAGGINGNITEYVFGNGGGGSLAAISQGQFSGNAATSSKWANARTITLTGSVTGSVSIDGSANVSLATTTNHTHTFASLAEKPATISGYGITDAYTASTIDSKLSGYLPLSGGTLRQSGSFPLTLDSDNSSFSGILSFTANGADRGRIYSDGTTILYVPTGWPKSYSVYHSGNCNNPSTPWSCSNLMASGNATIAGNVGIGTTSPAYKLDVAGTGRFTNAVTMESTLSVNNEIYSNAGIRMGGSDKSDIYISVINTYGTYYLGSDENGGYIYCNRDYVIKWNLSSRNVTIGSNLIVKGDTATGSDVRFKDIIKDHRIALESIAQAPLFTFKWKDREDDTIHLGTSAQYWEDVCPWLVKGTDFKVLDYSTLGVAIGISLANKTVDLEERVKILEKENEQLKKQIYGS